MHPCPSLSGGLRLDRERCVAEDFCFGLVAAARGLLHRSRSTSRLAGRRGGCHGCRRRCNCLRWRYRLRSRGYWLHSGWRWRPVLCDLFLRWSGCSLRVGCALDGGNHVAAPGCGGKRERGRRRRCRVQISAQIRRRLRRRAARRHTSDSDQRETG
jgi:hypothetical protein